MFSSLYWGRWTGYIYDSNSSAPAVYIDQDNGATTSAHGNFTISVYGTIHEYISMTANSAGTYVIIQSFDTGNGGTSTVETRNCNAGDTLATFHQDDGNYKIRTFYAIKMG